MQCFPELKNHEPLIHHLNTFCIKLQRHLANSPSAVDKIQKLIYHMYLEYIQDVFQTQLGTRNKQLCLPKTFVPMEWHPVIVTLSRLGYSRSVPPRMFGTRHTKLSLLDSMETASIILKKFPPHVPGFRPEEEYAECVYGNRDFPCLHQVLLLNVNVI
jgi:hypothetical protein